MATNVQQPLETNTTDLESLLQQINALPEAGGGETVGDWDAGDLAAAEIDDQTDILSQLAVVLASKGAGGNNVEQGEFTVDVDTASNTLLDIPFTNQHDTPPTCVVIVDATDSDNTQPNTISSIRMINIGQLVENGIAAAASRYYGWINTAAVSSTGTSMTNGTAVLTGEYGDDSNLSSNIGYYVSNSKIRRVHSGSNYVLVAGRTYKWIAIWL